MLVGTVFVIYDTMIKHHSHIHRYIIVHTHDDKTHTHVLIHRYEHDHKHVEYMNSKEHNLAHSRGL